MKRISRLKNLALLSALTGSAFAAGVPDTYYTAHHLKNPNANNATAAQAIVLPSTDWTRQFFVGVGVKSEWIRGQRFSTASVNVNGGPTILNAHDNYQAWVPELTLGYHFNQTPVLSSVFGPNADLAFIGSGFRSTTTSHPNGSTQGYFYYVNGILGTDGSSLMHNAYYRGKLSQYNLQLNYIGHWAMQNLQFSPYMGVAYHNDYENSQYNVQVQGGTPEVQLELDSQFRTRTSYTGLAFGNNFAYQMGSQWQALADLELEALYAHSALTANSHYYALSGAVANTYARATSTLTKDLTGKGTLAAGVRYAFSDKPDAMSVKLMGGIEAWAYAPKVVTSAAAKNDLDTNLTSSQGVPTHLASQSLVNPFVGLEFVAPIF